MLEQTVLPTRTARFFFLANRRKRIIAWCGCHPKPSTVRAGRTTDDRCCYSRIRALVDSNVMHRPELFRALIAFEQLNAIVSFCVARPPVRTLRALRLEEP
jgi:hypothetical protein